MSRQRCPHTNIVNCPLYVAAHDGEIWRFSCADGEIDAGACAVARSANYHEHLGLLRAHAPRLVAECEWRERLSEARIQREHNWLLHGVH